MCEGQHRCVPLQRYTFSLRVIRGLGLYSYENVARSPCSLFTVLRHCTPSPTIHLSEATRKPLALSRVFLLSSEGKSAILVKKKEPSRSGILRSMHVVLKTRHVSPISTHVDIRATYVAQTYLPLVHNFYPYADQQSHIGQRVKLYRFAQRPIRFIRPICIR